MLPLLLSAALAAAPLAPRLADGAGWNAPAAVFDLGPTAPAAPVWSMSRVSLPTAALPEASLAPGGVGVCWMALAAVALALEPSTLGTPAWAQDRGLSLSDRGRPYDLGGVSPGR
jgi:hypothetical protein